MKKFTTALMVLLLAGTLCNGDDEANQDIPDEVIKRVDPSVVAIQHELAVGSGFIVKTNGYILTNGHVVRGNDPEDPTKPATSVTVIMHNEKKYSAKVLGFCMDPDVALIKIEPDEPLHAVEFADSRKAQIGQKCFAVGTPVGMKRTFTSGMLSNVDRTDLGTFTKVFQTDAAINSGNSGGPLFDRVGHVLGVNTYAATRHNNLGFTIPAHVVQVLCNHIMEHGRFVRVGVPFSFGGEIYDEMGRALGTEKGILIHYVMPGTPADRAGFKMGDIIVAVDGKPCAARTKAESLDFNWEMITRKPGTRARFTIIRGAPKKKEKIEITATLEEMEPMPAYGRMPGELKVHRYESLGLMIRQLVLLHRVIHRLENETGVLVIGTEKGSAAGKAGLQSADIITHVGSKKIASVTEFQQELESQTQKGEKAIDLRIQRGKTILKTAIAPYYDLKEKKILLIIPESKSEHFPLILRELVTSGANITCAPVGNMPNTESLGTARTIELNKAKGSEYAVVLVTSSDDPAALQKNDDVKRIINEAQGKEKFLAAVGSSSIAVVAAHEDLRELKMTTSKSQSGAAMALKAAYTGKEVEKDGNLLTTTGFDHKAVRNFIKELRKLVM